MSADYSTCTGPYGTPIPLVHFDNILPLGGKLAVSFMPGGAAMFTTPRTPVDFDALAIVLSVHDRRILGELLLKDLPDE